MADKKCAHGGCNCTVKEGEEFCSKACEHMGVGTVSSCPCDHDGCEGHS